MAINDDRVALVTGGTRGIGLAIATVLREEGYRLTITARSPVDVEGTAVALGGSSGEVVGVVADVSAEADVTYLVDQHRAAHGRLDVLVNNAGTFTADSVSSTTASIFDAQIATNLRSAFLVTAAAVPLLRAAGAQHRKAHIVNVGSILGAHGQAFAASYAASKAGIAAMTQALHDELSRDGIRVTTLTPGFVNTSMTSALPMEREDLIQPEDLAESVRFLLRTSAGCAVPEIPFIRRDDRFLAALG